MVTIKKEGPETVFITRSDFPKIVRENNLQGIVEIELIIDNDCEIEVINFFKSLVGTVCDEVALKVIRKLVELIRKYSSTF